MEYELAPEEWMGIKIRFDKKFVLGNVVVQAYARFKLNVMEPEQQVMVYGRTKDEALKKIKLDLALAMGAKEEELGAQGEMIKTVNFGRR